MAVVAVSKGSGSPSRPVGPPGDRRGRVVAPPEPVISSRSINQAFMGRPDPPFGTDGLLKVTYNSLEAMPPEGRAQKGGEEDDQEEVEKEEEGGWGAF